ncbi:MAG: LytTR family DNA-binding domain-containing protein [Ferruginibacter sp.]
MNIASYSKAILVKREILVSLLLTMGFVCIGMLQDYMEAGFNNFSFYFSESFMFSSFWWLFAPFLYIQYAIAQKRNPEKVFVKIMLICLPVLLHLLLFPALVWLISKLFYYHTFSYIQTFRFALPEHLNKVLLLYSIPLLAYQYFYKRRPSNDSAETPLPAVTAEEYPASFMVSEANRHILVPASEILYFTASPPYVYIHLSDKKHLASLTLKSVLEKTGNKQFVRIHKSSIVNVKEVASFASRYNGDYDLTLKNGTRLRLSRNYAAGFKKAFQQLTIK